MIFLVMMLWAMIASAAPATVATMGNHPFLDDSAVNLPCGIPMSMSGFKEIQSMDISSYNVSSPDTGAAWIFGNGDDGPRAWGRDNNGRIPIYYCYVDQPTRDYLKVGVEAAIKIWYDGLGGPASKSTGHAIEFKERTANNKDKTPLFCTKRGSTELGGWNKDVPYETLAIVSPPGNQANTATVGTSKKAKKEPWNLMLTIAAHDNPPTIAHELGHVLG
jgi:hypothetical protein